MHLFDDNIQFIISGKLTIKKNPKFELIKRFLNY